nr:immunoglobulin heavy chain junction region [Mus musculus]
TVQEGGITTTLTT